MRITIKIQLFFILVMALFMEPSVAYESCCYPFYVGLTGGYGSTTWGNLVADDMNDALSTSVPLQVTEGGAVWGFYAGYKLIPAFAVELSFMQYPIANMTFDETSIFTYEHNQRTHLSTLTSRIALMGKFLLAIPKTNIRAYSSVGPAAVHRNDVAVDRWRLSPAFGAGFEWDLTNHIMMELGTEYVAGYGQSELDPAQHFIPFLYSVFLRGAYRL